MSGHRFNLTKDHKGDLVLSMAVETELTLETEQAVFHLAGLDAKVFHSEAHTDNPLKKNIQ